MTLQNIEKILRTPLDPNADLDEQLNSRVAAIYRHYKLTRTLDTQFGEISAAMALDLFPKCFEYKRPKNRPRSRVANPQLLNELVLAILEGKENSLSTDMQKLAKAVRSDLKYRDKHPTRQSQHL